jgi:DNA-binding CsgD family transcriptional regulator
MPVRKKFTEWLSFHPSTDEIARAVATEYLNEFSVRGVRFGQVNSDDSIMMLGQFGYQDADQYKERVIPSHEWRSFDSPDITIVKSGHKEQWNPTDTFFVTTLRDCGVTHGYLIIEFVSPIPESDKALITERVDSFAATISLYLSFQNPTFDVNTLRIKTINETSPTTPGQLSARQLSILKGMVQGKTNHELAVQLGFSVSTIRHETMRIYEALGVSDRKEASEKAIVLRLI